MHLHPQASVTCLISYSHSNTYTVKDLIENNGRPVDLAAFLRLSFWFTANKLLSNAASNILRHRLLILNTYFLLHNGVHRSDERYLMEK